MFHVWQEVQEDDAPRSLSCRPMRQDALRRPRLLTTLEERAVSQDPAADRIAAHRGIRPSRVCSGTPLYTHQR